MYMKKFISLFLILISYSLFAQAIDLDSSIDDEIRKNYKVEEKIEEELPELPKILQTTPTNVKIDSSEIIKNKITTSEFKGTLKGGTKFYVVNDNAITDSLKKGRKVTFHTTKPVYTKSLTIPAGTKFYTEVTDAHPPQISCNGGLVEIKVHSVVIDNSVTLIDGYITRANGKKIFLNNIKGKRTYLKTLWNKTGFGRNLFNKMLTLTLNLGNDGATIVLSPFPITYGTVVLGLNTLSSPILALFSKGGRVNIPVGTEFVIKIKDDVGVYY